MALAINPGSDIAVRQSSARRVFGACLFWGTAAAFFLGAAQPIIPGNLFIPLQWPVMFLALIHVPLTTYLLADPLIRARVLAAPISMILVPICWVIASVSVFTYIGDALPQGHNWIQADFMLAVVAWQNWHFGRQNLGVMAFTHQAEIGSPKLASHERQLINYGALLGVFGTLVLFPQQILPSAPQSDFSVLLSAVGFVRWIGLALSAALLIQSARYMRTYSWQTGLMFLFSANFFAPIFISNSAAVATNVFACSILGHGTQYVTFLGFHASQYGKRWNWQRYVMLGCFVVAVVVTGDISLFHHLIPDNWISKQINHVLHYHSMTSLATGLGVSVLLIHFWVDSIVWRFREKQSREWMMTRFEFLF